MKVITFGYKKVNEGIKKAARILMHVQDQIQLSKSLPLVLNGN